MKTVKALKALRFAKRYCLAGIILAGTLSNAPGAIRYVNVANLTPVPPYTNWASAATNIQDAVDVANAGDEIVVTNGVYATAGRERHAFSINHVEVTKPVTVRSVNGPEVTVIRGYQVSGMTNSIDKVRCVYLDSGAALVGFTLANGAAYRGGGAFGGTFKNCTFIGNSAYQGGGAAFCTLINCVIAGNSAASDGGGAYGGTLSNCVLTGNSAGDVGGGAAGGSILNNCLLTGNRAYIGGGASGGLLNNCTVVFNSSEYSGGVSDDVVGGIVLMPAVLHNCIVWSNQAPVGPNYVERTLATAIFTYSCTTPLPNGIGNFDDAPLFVDQSSGNLRLQSNSPCINSGHDLYAPASPDLDGNPRIVGGTADVGAYEFQSPQSIISYAWLYQYGLPTDGSVDNLDFDGDGFTNFQESRTGTDPNDAVSALRLLTPLVNGFFAAVSWESVPGRTYTIERSETLGESQSFVPVATDIPAELTGNLTTYTDFDADILAPSRFYRVRVE